MSIWQTIGHFFANLFGALKSVAQHELPKAIELVNNIKNFDAANPEVADILTGIIPGTWDDNLKNLAREKLPEIILKLQLGNECAQAADTNAFLKCAFEKLKQLDPKVQWLTLQNISVLLTDAFADGKVTVPEIMRIGQAVYDAIHNPQALIIPADAEPVDD